MTLEIENQAAIPDAWTFASLRGCLPLEPLATSLREHRGDSHVHVLSVAGLDGCEVHQLHAAQHRTPAQVLREEIESETNKLAMEPIKAALDQPRQGLLLQALSEPAKQVVASGVIPFPNPIGLTRL